MNPLAPLGFNYLDDFFIVVIFLNMLASYREGFIAKAWFKTGCRGLTV